MSGSSASGFASIITAYAYTPNPASACSSVSAHPQASARFHSPKNALQNARQSGGCLPAARLLVMRSPAVTAIGTVTIGMQAVRNRRFSLSKYQSSPNAVAQNCANSVLSACISCFFCFCPPISPPRFFVFSIANTGMEVKNRSAYAPVSLRAWLQGFRSF